MSLISFLKFFFKRGISTNTKTHIKKMLKSVSSPLNYEDKKSLIIQLDSALGLVLSDLYGKNSVGTNLKKAKNRFSKEVYNQLWHAHKIRNILIHEPTKKINSKDLDTALKVYKKVFIELKAY